MPAATTSNECTGYWTVASSHVTCTMVRKMAAAASIPTTMRGHHPAGGPPNRSTGARTIHP